jgi:hypothetical protein
MKDNHIRGKRSAGISGAYAEIPKRLREYYDSLQEEAIPDRFLDLLEKLDLAERAAKRNDAVEEFK